MPPELKETVYEVLQLGRGQELLDVLRTEPPVRPDGALAVFVGKCARPAANLEQQRAGLVEPDQLCIASRIVGHVLRFKGTALPN